MNNFILGFKFAISYFSIIPVKFKDGVDLSKKEILSSMLLSFPILGLLLGLIVISLYNFFFFKLDFLGALICSVIYMILYGFIHTEAVIDVVDAIYAKHSGKDAKKIIKEPTIGAIGAFYGFSVFVVKVCAFTYLLKNELFLELLVVLILSRLSLVYLVKTFDYESSFVNSLKNSIEDSKYFLFFIFISVLTLILISLKALILLFIAIIFSNFFMKFLNKKLGFLNGDCLGISLEVIEVILAISLLFLV